MSKHISRKQRWTQVGPKQYNSERGKVVYQENAWYAVFDYRTLASREGETPAWAPHHARLGPYKRPRNAMVALERETTALKNRFARNILFGDQVWAEA